MLCPNCESENREGAKFCDECGFPLTGAIAARAAEAVSAESNEPETPVIPEQPTEALDVVSEEPEEEKPETTAEADDQATDANADSGTPLGDPDFTRPDATAVIGADFTGLDQIEGEYGERIVGPGYQEPQANWRDGHTMQLPKIEGDEPPRSKDFLASSAKKQNNSKKAIIAIIVGVIAVALIAAFATYQMQLWGGKVVPDVTGMTEADATSVLEDSGFAVRSTQVKSDDTEGLVLISDPAGGARAGEGDEIVIHIATAREIPNIVGKAESDAKEALAEAGYENVTFAKERSDEAEGTVLSVSPEAGTRAKSNVAVTVKVAEPYVVPDTSALSLDESIDAIQQAGLAYDIAYIDTQEFADGSVIGTEPVAGTKVKHDTVVVIDVARARGIQLVQLTRELIVPGYELSLEGTSYIVSSLSATNYLGNDQVAFTATARPYMVFFGVYVEGDPQQVSGVVTWTADNQVASIS